MATLQKVLIIAAKLHIGGAEKVARDIALYAPEGKYQFHYLVFGDEVGAYEAQVMEKGAKVFHWAQPSEGYFPFFRKLLKLMKQENYHAVHAHTMFNCGFVMLAAALAGFPVIFPTKYPALKCLPVLWDMVWVWVLVWLSPPSRIKRVIVFSWSWATASVMKVPSGKLPKLLSISS
jgi:hypothetical protein